MIKACIFDLDGTLLNTINTIAYYGNMALNKYNIGSYETDAYKYMVGNGAKILVERMLDGKGKSGDPELFEKVYKLYTEAYDRDVEYGTAPYDGIISLLDELNSRGILTAVLSNKPDFASKQAVQTFLDGYFDVVHGQRENIAIKPSAEGATEIMNELGVTPDEVLYIGDTWIDMQTGKKSGAFTVGVLWGFRDRKELEDNNADAIIEKPCQLLDYLLVR